MKVLIVDDSPVLQRSLSHLLESIPGVHVVGYAEDVQGALAAFESGQPDLVVLDVELRGRDRGIDVLRHVVRERPQTRVMMLSNFGWQAMRSGLLEAGAHAYFDKGTEFMQAKDWVAALVVARGEGGPGGARDG